MAGKKPKYSAYNNAGNKLDRSVDGSKSVPKPKKGVADSASNKTFSTKTGNGKKGK